jgi:hypothetical protein
MGSCSMKWQQFVKRRDGIVKSSQNIRHAKHGKENHSRTIPTIMSYNANIEKIYKTKIPKPRAVLKEKYFLLLWKKTFRPLQRRFCTCTWSGHRIGSIQKWTEKLFFNCDRQQGDQIGQVFAISAFFEMSKEPQFFGYSFVRKPIKYDRIWIR